MKTLEERFWEFVDKRDPDKCWNWTGAKIRGYARLSVDGKNRIASRVSWQLHFGEIPDRMEICHTCDNPACVNPTHLFLGTHLDNVRDMVAKGRGAKQRGEKHPLHKLTWAEVDEIRKLYDTGSFTQMQLGNKYGVARPTICHVVNFHHWRKDN